MFETFREFIEETLEINEGKNEDLAIMMFKSQGVSEEEIKKILDKSKEEDLKLSIKGSKVYFTKTGKTSNIKLAQDDYLKKYMKGRETYQMLCDILKKDSFNISSGRSGNTSSGTLSYKAYFGVEL